MNEYFSPVCSPDYCKKMGGLQSIEDVARCQLNHEIGMLTTWERWFAAIRLPVSRHARPRLQSWQHVD